MKRLFFLGLLLLLLEGCGKKVDEVLPTNPQDLLGDWVLVSPKTAYTITLQIKPDPNYYTANIIPPSIFMISGKGPVNQYNSVLNYAPRGSNTQRNEIRITDAARSSKVGETDEVKQYTDFYLGALNTVSSYNFSADGQLQLRYCLWCELSVTTLTFQRQ